MAISSWITALQQKLRYFGVDGKSCDWSACHRGRASRVEWTSRPRIEELEPRLVPTVQIIEYSHLASNSTPTGITVGPDGALWFTEPGTDRIGRIDTSGNVTDFSIPTSNSQLTGITAGPDGNLWFTEADGDKIGRITTSGGVTEFPLAAGSSPTDITLGPDGNLWFTEENSDKIGRITPGGTLTEFTLNSGSRPAGITAGPDGNLWFTEANSNQIGRITPGGTLTEFSIPTLNSLPYSITPGPDGNLWFTEITGNQIGQITTSGVITEYGLPTTFGQPFDITEGQDGNLWFTEANGNQIGQITTSGILTEYAIPTFFSEPLGITTSPDGSFSLWFAEESGNQIGRLTITSLSVMDAGGIYDGNPFPATYTLNGVVGGSLEGVTPTLTYYAGSDTTGTILGSAPPSVPGTYTVVAHFAGSTNYASADSNPVTFTITSLLCVTVVRDFNGNGLEDPGEFGLAGMRVYLDLNYNGQRDRGEPDQVTDASGKATFIGLAPGTYLVRQDLSATPGVDLTNGADAGLSVSAIGLTSVVLGDLLYSPAAPVSSNSLIYGSSNPDASSAYIAGLYRSLLGRDADAAGLAWWVGQLNGGTSRNQIVQGFLNSPEHRGQEVDVYYQTFLHRTADPAGRTFWVNQFLGGADEADVLQGFLTSGEFQAAHTDVNLFVQDMYLDLLGRTPDAAGSAYWLGLLSTGAKREDVVAGFVRSGEVAARAVDGFYAAYLHRPADSAASYWLSLWTGGLVRLTDIAAGYLTSDEFFNNGAATVS